jgi:hypothetical protein
MFLRLAVAVLALVPMAAGAGSFDDCPKLNRISLRDADVVMIGDVRPKDYHEGGRSPGILSNFWRVTPQKVLRQRGGIPPRLVLLMMSTVWETTPSGDGTSDGILDSHTTSIMALKRADVPYADFVVIEGATCSTFKEASEMTSAVMYRNLLKP